MEIPQHIFPGNLPFGLCFSLVRHYMTSYVNFMQPSLLNSGLRLYDEKTVKKEATVSHVFPNLRM